jgi:antiviral helicase SLH1
LTPRKALARNVSIRIRKTFSRILSTPTLLLSRPNDIDNLPPNGSFIAVSAPTPLLDYVIDDPTFFSQLDLIIVHDLHALDPAYELLLSRLRWKHPDTRIVGSSSSLSDATDLSSWLSASPRSTYSFSPSSRSSALTTSFQSFSTPHSASLLRSMIKPAYSAMRLATGSTICFVPSRAQCRSTANDLVTQTAADLEQSFVVGSIETIGVYAQSIQDPDLAEALSHGIAVFHEGLRPEEQRLALDLFNSGAVRILIASREACWTLPVKASLVVVLSAQYAIVKKDNEREIKGYPLAELLQMQSLAVPPSSDTSAECLILCQIEQAELYSRFLLQGLPLESELPLEEGISMLTSVLYTDLVASRITHRQDVVDSLSWSYFSRRFESNPSYYATRNSKGDSTLDSQLSRLADRLLITLELRGCLIFHGKIEIELTMLGELFAYYGMTLDDIERLQAADLSKLVDLAQDSDWSSMDEVATVALSNFHSRLPRPIKDSIGSAEGIEVVDYQKRILLAAFLGGKIPRGAGGLEKVQHDIVKRILDVTGVMDEE